MDILRYGRIFIRLLCTLTVGFLRMLRPRKVLSTKNATSKPGPSQQSKRGRQERKGKKRKKNKQNKKSKHDKENIDKIEEPDKQIENEDVSNTQIELAASLTIEPESAISRITWEVLQQIFEYAVEVGYCRFHCATVLSHVCSWWREVALETPSLWTKIQVLSLRHEKGELFEFWSRTVEKVKDTAARVTIVLDGRHHKELEAIRLCDLKLLPQIEYLRLLLRNEHAQTTIATLLRPPMGRLGHLHLEGETPPNLTIDASIIIRRFQKARSVAIVSFSHILFSPSLTIDSVTILSIRKVAKISLHSIIQVFSNLTDVSFIETTFEPHSGPHPKRIPWPRLRKLTVLSCPSLPWRSINATSVTHLSYWDGPDKDVTAFITSNTSLEYLDIAYSKNFYYIAARVPQLLSLTIDPCNELTNPKRMKLNKLIHLGIYDHHEHPLTVELFERIIWSLFLVGGIDDDDPLGSVMPVTLEILVECSCFDHEGVGAGEVEGRVPEWKRSDLLFNAAEDEGVPVVRRRGRVYRAYRMRWEWGSYKYDESGRISESSV